MLDSISGIISNYGVFFLKGAGFTLMYSALTVLFGTLGGIVFALMKLSKSRILRFVASLYIEVIRGTPLLVQLFIIFYGLPSLGINLDRTVAAVMALSINSSAYVAEIVRAGIQAVDKGQTEAGRSLGLSGWQTMRMIVLPQAIRNILPALGNEFVTVIKESSLASIIGLKELMYNAQGTATTTFLTMECYLVAAALYFIMTFTLSKILAYVEKRMRSESRMPHGSGMGKRMLGFGRSRGGDAK
ncbi:amino acid ABC transporter permease [Gehongia tenuis]